MGDLYRPGLEIYSEFDEIDLKNMAEEERAICAQKYNSSQY